MIALLPPLATVDLGVGIVARVIDQRGRRQAGSHPRGDDIENVRNVIVELRTRERIRRRQLRIGVDTLAPRFQNGRLPSD